MRIWKVNRDQYAVGEWWESCRWRVQTGAERERDKLSGRRVSWHRNGEIRVYHLWGSNYTALNLVNQVLPAHVYVERIDTVCWVVTEQPGHKKKYYRIPRKNGLRLKQDEHGVWQALNAPPVHRYRFDREVAKQVLKKVWPFREFVETMWPMLDNDVVEAYKPAGPYYYPYQLKYEEHREAVLKDRSEWLGAVKLAKQHSGRYEYDSGSGRWARRYSTSPDGFLKNYIDEPVIVQHKDKFIKETLPPGTYVRRNRRFE